MACIGRALLVVGRMCSGCRWVAAAGDCAGLVVLATAVSKGETSRRRRGAGAVPQGAPHRPLLTLQRWHRLVVCGEGGLGGLVDASRTTRRRTTGALPLQSSEALALAWPNLSSPQVLLKVALRSMLALWPWHCRLFEIPTRVWAHHCAITWHMADS